LPQRTVVIDFGVAQIFVRQRPQAVYGVLHGKLTSPHLP